MGSLQLGRAAARGARAKPAVTKPVRAATKAVRKANVAVARAKGKVAKLAKAAKPNGRGAAKRARA